jgi:hypothetical protein
MTVLLVTLAGAGGALLRRANSAGFHGASFTAMRFHG